MMHKSKFRSQVLDDSPTGKAMAYCEELVNREEVINHWKTVDCYYCIAKKGFKRERSNKVFLEKIPRSKVFRIESKSTHKSFS